MSYLDRIFETKRREIADAKAELSLDEVRAKARDADPVRGFRKALAEAEQPVTLIAEVKAASPSMGSIRPNLDPVEVARTYESAGAHCLSVLTDVEYFKGSPQNLIKSRESTSIPVLRKDFIEDPYQVYEARSWGADAILLIVAALEQSRLRDLQALAWQLGMDVLVEIHDEQEAERALEAKANLIGINNRDLSSFQTDIETSIRLLPQIKAFAHTVSESSLATSDDVQLVSSAGARSVLIGTTFCAAEDIGAKVKEVMRW
ncbi:MAG: indole-3-glycerol phosphate synthase TrpC [Fimbriimonadaceae bacterium]|nr:indole-3-glycerol phosphate synthase TrpC [Fimbriimonadaceae bacterium]